MWSIRSLLTSLCELELQRIDIVNIWLHFRLEFNSNQEEMQTIRRNEFRPVLHHNDGPKFRLKLSVPEVSLYVLPIYLVSKLLHAWISTFFKKKKGRRLIHALIISTGHILSFKLNLWQTLALLDLFKEKDTMATSFLSPAASLISYCIIRKLQTKRETTHKRTHIIQWDLIRRNTYNFQVSKKNFFF